MDDVELIADDENIDVFAISETWLNSNISDDEVSIPGYQLFRSDRTLLNDHGGVICHVKDSLSAVHRNDLNDDAIEALWVEIKPKYTKPVLLYTFYRTPMLIQSTFTV